MKRIKVAMLAGILAGVVSFAGCSKKAAKATPPSNPPAPPAPTATLAASPATIQQGQSATLTWQTQNATDITVEGLGTVAASGSQSVSPNSSTTYTLVAKGPGGSQDASARVTVSMPSTASTISPSDADLFAKNVKDVLFDYNKANIRDDQTSRAQGDAAFLLQHPEIKILVEGHCDDRGSEEYNLALGTSRAETLKKSLLEQGVPAERIKTISYGKEKPFCTQENDSCWQQNRVDHFSMAQ